jgi:hypothetical protein
MDDGVSIFVVAIIALAEWLNISSKFIQNEMTIYKLERSEKLSIFSKYTSAPPNIAYGIIKQKLFWSFEGF